MSTDFHPDDTIRTQADIQRWLTYWGHSTVNLGEIKSVDDMRVARKFVQEMNCGLFWNIGDDAMYDALAAMRARKFLEAECEKVAMEVWMAPGPF